MGSTWQVQSAKQRFSEVVRAAEAGEPQFITRHGQTVAVLVDINHYREGQHPKKPFVDFLLAGPELDGLEPPARVAEPDRAIGLFEDAR